MKKCTDCRYCIKEDYGYSNYSVEGTTADCLLHLNPGLPEDQFYGEEPKLLYAEECPRFSPSDGVYIDCDIVDGDIVNYSDDPEIKALLAVYRYLNGKSPFSKEWDIIGPWSESLKFIFPSPRLFKDVFSYIAGDSDGTWYLYEFLPYINKETKKFNVKKGNIAPIEFIQMPTFPSNQWIETLHLADRIADIWVPIKGESLQ